GDGLKAVLMAAKSGDPELLRLLLRHHANVNQADPVTGNTALMLAANRGAVQAVTLLLAAGANVNARAKDGWTALEAARMIGDNEIESLLKKAGARETSEP
ncbi:MAG: ankyrin repeat domain-containing protein, partial [Gammaproteobacteria bacterium]|nr:ankyrin repeat domain-containing protein [Gammaproteobacteria bacterium]